MVRLIDIIKKDRVIKVLPGATLSSALSKLTTSHDAAFVFSQEGKYLGLINPYYCLIKSSYPGNAKVEHCLFHAPRVRTDYSVSKVASLFIESKVHYLPVFDEQENFVGIVSARRLLSRVIRTEIFNSTIKEILMLKRQPLITTFENETVANSLNIFKKSKVSKIIILSKDLKLKGILSYYDLVSYLISPKGSQGRGERKGNKISFNNLTVKNFAKSYVLTLSPNKLLHDVLDLVLRKKIGSVVIVDESKHPIGIITTKDLLRFLLRNNNSKEIEISSQNLSDTSKKILGNFLNYFGLWLKKFPGLNRVKMFVKEEKKGNLFEVILSLIPHRGNTQVVKKEGKNLSKILRDISKE